METESIEVVYRYWEGEVIALFPELAADDSGNILSYQQVGQHGGADYDRIIARSRPATAEESAPLAAELESLGYRLVPVRRRPR